MQTVNDICMCYMFKYTYSISKQMMSQTCVCLNTYDVYDSTTIHIIYSLSSVYTSVKKTFLGICNVLVSAWCACIWPVRALRKKKTHTKYIYWRKKKIIFKMRRISRWFKVHFSWNYQNVWVSGETKFYSLDKSFKCNTIHWFAIQIYRILCTPS